MTTGTPGLLVSAVLGGPLAQLELVAPLAVEHTIKFGARLDIPTVLIPFVSVKA